MKLSIIIPIYNKARYLLRCLNSILKNKGQEFECICIDDCSTDRSGQIAATFCKQHPKFKYFHFDKNKGVSAARNFGLEQASGEGISFVDADDFIEPERYTYTINGAINNNALICGCTARFWRLNRIHKLKHYIEGKKLIVLSVSKNAYKDIDIAGVTNLVYHRDLIGDVRFRNCSYAEDMIFNQELMCKYDILPGCNIPLFNYDLSAMSLGRDPSEKRIKQTMQCGEEMIESTHHPLAEKLGTNIQRRKYFKNYNLKSFLKNPREN